MDNVVTKKNNVLLWHITSGVLLALLIVSIFTDGFNFGLSKEEASARVVSYVRGLPNIGSVSLNDVESEKDLYKLSLVVDGQQIESYVTKDGSLLFPTGIVISGSGSAITGSTVADTAGVQRVNAEPGDAYVKGDNNAKVTIIEYSDFQCPFCERFYSAPLPQIINAYVDTGKARIAYKHFPLTNIHPDAQKSAEASECAGEQGKFWEYHDMLFENQQSLGITSLKSYAVKLGLNAAKFNECLDSGKYENKVNNNIQEGSASGITGTPGFIINGIRLSGAQPFEQFQRIIEAELNGEEIPTAEPQQPQPVKIDTSNIVDDDTIKGNNNAKVTIVSFEDYQCPFCERVQPALKQIEKEYGDKVRFVFRDFPLRNIHPQAQIASEAAECAGEQNKYWEYHDVLFGNQQALDAASLKKYAADLKLDTNKFNECLDSGKMQAEVDKDLNDGSALGVTGTPTFFINGQKLVGAQPYSEFKRIIDAEL